MRYIGGKALLLDYIIETINSEAENVNTVIDIFSGSGVVGNALKAKGYSVLSNDFLYFSYVIARGTVGISTEPLFANFKFDVIDYLNHLTWRILNIRLNNVSYITIIPPMKIVIECIFKTEMP